MSITIGVSLKAYFGYRDTLRWASAVAEIARSRSNSSIELFVLPAFPALAPVRDILTGSGLRSAAKTSPRTMPATRPAKSGEPCWPMSAATMPRSDTRNVAGNSAKPRRSSRPKQRPPCGTGWCR